MVILSASDLALSFGDTNHLAAFGTVEIPMFTVFQPIEDL